MVEKKYSTTGHPLLVGGPQIGYFYPGFTYEIDMHAADLHWRGATSAPFPGYMLIGRGKDFATTLTSAGSDVIDQYAETLCGGSDTMYLYKGKCTPMGTVDAGTLDGNAGHLQDRRSTGPSSATRRCNGTKVAISSKRSSFGKDSLDLLYNRRLSNGQVHSAEVLRAGRGADAADVQLLLHGLQATSRCTAPACCRSGPKGIDPSLPTVGTGQYEWKGFLPPKKHIQGIDPQKTPVKGTMVNWNNISAHGFGAG